MIESATFQAGYCPECTIRDRDATDAELEATEAARVALQQQVAELKADLHALNARAESAEAEVERLARINRENAKRVLDRDDRLAALRAPRAGARAATKRESEFLMGLDTSHDCWHGAYSAFTRWRNHLAEVASYKVYPVQYDGGVPCDTIMLEWHRYREHKELQGEWDETPHDPLIVLFAHSDCDGLIHPVQAGPLADRLTELLPKLQGEGGGHIGNYREKTEQFIKGLRAAVEANEDVDFH